MEEENRKISMADQISIAVSSPKNYKQLTKLKTGKIVLFMFVITFLLVFIEFGITVVTFLMKNGGLKKIALNKVPQFTYDGATLSMDEKFEMAFGDIVIYVDTNEDKVNTNSIKTDGAYVAIGKKYINMGVVSGDKAYDYMGYRMSFLFPSEFDNQKLADITPAIYIYLILVYLLYMMGKALKILLYALLFSIIANTFSNNFHTGLSYGQVLKVCIYGLTLPMLIGAVNTSAGYLISPTLVTIITVFIAVSFINRGILSHANLEIPPKSM